MTCGDSAHGSLNNCIRNGGCGITFLYDTLQVVQDSRFTDLDGQRKVGNPVTARMKAMKKHPKCARYVFDSCISLR